MSVSRRVFLAGSAATATAVTAGSVAACGASTSELPSNSQDTPQPLKEAVVEFDGAHQAGIETPTQASLNLVGFNLREGVDVRGVARLMRLWTADARALCAGETPLGSLEPEMNEWPANLTITCGFGEKIFDIAAPSSKPAWLRDLPAFTRDQLDPKWGQTDLVLQICSDDPVMCAWAMRHMTRAGMDYATTAWVQQGFMNAYGAIPKGQTPRNLFGQVDGTVNPHSAQEYDEQVWIEGPEGFAGSTSLIVRRIAMHLDEWELLDRASREEALGRTLADGSPLTGGGEFSAPELEATDQFGLPVIDRNSHMARAMPPAEHPEQRFRRRPYNYNLPPEPGSAELSNAGLVFICFQKDPDVQFTPVQSRLDEVDRLNTWITHIGSAVYWVPPGTSQSGAGDEYWGQSVLGA
ncbi:Dyp-type peroxidase [Corynebacterium lipophiloflavum]|uniref:Tat-translocated enzyme n=1 Tax=Corynebacterium lipophiloflavum (strain ATCC 700352 / DSM 44291 / CCUG 37336 / JCM 10383 / DMMZ 1944) TaxID=525263 RepID=C0XSN7_CORLD|nr:Dyp-type peroxidase [Corynebacterium lipophiloflavum]EEI16748.1 putative Tat-translocated enzyme [Corynebacterium lipophiloflavum DSM 44291]